jgi:hypothetical protein
MRRSTYRSPGGGGLAVRRGPAVHPSGRRPARSRERDHVRPPVRQRGELGRPQFRSTVHLVSSPTVTNEIHQVWPVSRARSGSARRPRKLAEETSVSRTTKLTPGRHAGTRTGQPRTHPTPDRSRTIRGGPYPPPRRPAGRLGDGPVPPQRPHRRSAAQALAFCAQTSRSPPRPVILPRQRGTRARIPGRRFPGPARVPDAANHRLTVTSRSASATGRCGQSCHGPVLRGQGATSPKCPRSSDGVRVSLARSIGAGVPRVPDPAPQYAHPPLPPHLRG